MIKKEEMKDFYQVALIRDLIIFAINQDYEFIISEHIIFDDWLMENFGTNSQELNDFTGLGEEIFDYYPVNSMGYIKNASEIKILEPKGARV